LDSEVAERERRLAGDVLAAYAEALAALHELEITEGLNEIDLQTARFVEIAIRWKNPFLNEHLRSDR
jgi:hypothetical protein